MIATWVIRARRVTAHHVNMATVTAPVPQAVCIITVLVKTVILAWIVIKILTNAQIIRYAGITGRVGTPMEVFGARWAIFNYFVWFLRNIVVYILVWIFLVSSRDFLVCSRDFFFVHVIFLFVHMISLFVHVIFLFAHVIFLFVHVISLSWFPCFPAVSVILSIYLVICWIIWFVHQPECLLKSI